MLGSADLSGLKQNKQHWATDWATLALAQGVCLKKQRAETGGRR
jgi:hypothetical protein